MGSGHILLTKPRSGAQNPPPPNQHPSLSPLSPLMYARRAKMFGHGCPCARGARAMQHVATRRFQGATSRQGYTSNRPFGRATLCEGETCQAGAGKMAVERAAKCGNVGGRTNGGGEVNGGDGSGECDGECDGDGGGCGKDSRGGSSRKTGDGEGREKGGGGESGSGHSTDRQGTVTTATAGWWIWWRRRRFRYGGGGKADCDAFPINADDSESYLCSHCSRRGMSEGLGLLWGKAVGGRASRWDAQGAGGG